MTRTLTVAALQLPLPGPVQPNIDAVSTLVEEAAAKGAQVILPPELFEGPYFCQVEDEALFASAHPTAEHPSVVAMQALAAKLKVAIPTSFFERDGHHYYNTLAMIGPDGDIMGTYRKSHIPDGPGYQEKFYFSPGDTGIPVFKTRYATVGCAICWDQWFPETARIMALKGAEILLYPTAIGSEPQDPGIDSQGHWTRVMQGHAGANLMPLVASNRIGREEGDSCGITFYGSSFIADPQGEIVAQADREHTTVLTASFDLDRIAAQRASWGVFRDRRPELYGALLTLDGETTPRR